MMDWHAIFSDRMDHPLQGRVAWIYNEGGTSVAVVTEEGDANLIAAAPDLLAALEEARHFVVLQAEQGYDFPTLERIDAAIAKATGKDA
jgi:hypothetical protein